MKYPQLVSSRAVNAISDWLVSRLEQLGVEAPQIYTRLLLSLLQSSVQINDPIEFSNLENYFANRKGHNRRYHLTQCDTDTLKKLNAIQCLKEIVSTEQEIDTIVNLVDELCEKLQDIEKQLADTEDAEKPLVALTLTVSQKAEGAGAALTTPHVKDSLAVVKANPIGLEEQQYRFAKSQQRPLHGNTSNAEQLSVGAVASQPKLCDTTAHRVKDLLKDSFGDNDNDPKKRYFRAFPALSKEMEESFRVWRRNAKSFTWPVNANVNSNSSSSASQVIKVDDHKLSSAAGGGVGGVKPKRSADERAVVGVSVAHNSSSNNCGGGLANLGNCDKESSCSLGGGVKRKSKRRRNRALSKGRTIQSLRKSSIISNPLSVGGLSSTSSTASGPSSLTTTGSRRLYYQQQQPQQQQQRLKSSSPFWDTNFEGCWEMGPDLIQEFIAKQKNKNSNNIINNNSNKRRNQKFTNMKLGAVADRKHLDKDDDDDANHKTASSNCRESPLMPVVDISFCCGDDDDDDDIDYDDSLMTISDLPMDKPAKRLYERETLLLAPDADVDADTFTMDDTKASDDIALFTSKFNSDVEALWKDAPEESLEVSTATDPSVGPVPMFSFASLPCVAPFKENLMNFWSNYYNHHFDNINATAHGGGGGVGGGVADESLTTTNSQSLSCSGSGSALNSDLANTSDYYSMPSNLDDFEKSVGAIGRRAGVGAGANPDDDGAGCGGGGRQTPIGLFLQNTIWSENSCNVTGGDTDESFYLKVWNSNKKLNQLDAAQAGNKSHAIESGGSAAYIFPPYNNSSSSKWSEGINAGPPPPSHSQLSLHVPSSTASSGSLISNYNTNNNNNNNNTNNLVVDCTDSTNNTASNSNTASVSTTSCSSSYAPSHSAAAYNWQTPIIGQNLQADLNSWSTSNPMSLTDMYGGGGAGVANPDSGVIADMLPPKSKPKPVETCPPDEVDSVGANISLPNHQSNGSSGFVEYARIKPLMQALKSTSGSAAAAYPPPSSTQANQQVEQTQQYPEDDDLLTSERTHFHPIRSYSDGHTFDICSAIDVIAYSRSESGDYMYLDGHRYMEYVRPDNYIVEDDGTSGTASSNPLYAKRYNRQTESRLAKKKAGAADGSPDFTLKFRMRNTDFMCQANEENILAETTAASKYYAEAQKRQQQQPHPLALIFSGAAQQMHSSNSIEALNKAVAAAAKAAAAAHIPADSHWMPIASGGINTDDNNYRPSVWTSVQANKGDDWSCDEVDFFDIIGGEHLNLGSGNVSVVMLDDNSTCSLNCPLDHQWSMREVGQNCCGSSHNNNNNNNNIIENNNNINNNNVNNTYDSLDIAVGGGGVDGRNGGPHTLWGMCAACNGELKSVPANRLLRDELQQEADEIMSDLKYMQDLYIGRSGADDDNEENEHEHVDEDVDDDDDVTNVTERGMSSVSDDDSDAMVAADGGEDVVNASHDEDESEVMAANLDLCLTKAARDKRNKYLKETLMNVEEELVEQQPLPETSADSRAAKPQSETHIVLQKVNRLIADLLRPENTVASNSSTATATNNNNNNTSTSSLSLNQVEDSPASPTCSGGPSANNDDADNKQFSGGIWYGKNERNIWQSSSDMVDSNALKPMELLRHFQMDPVDGGRDNDKHDNDDYMKLELNWEHENLAKIWNADVKEPNDGIVREAGESNQGHQKEPPRSSSKNDKTEMPRKTTATALASSIAAYKRVQQFLNSNATNAGSSSTSAKLRLTNRKRRHSASQNFFHQSAAALAFHNNNNNMDVADLNVNNMKYFVAAGGNSDFSGLQKFMNLAKKSYNDDGSTGAAAASAADGVGGAEQTIITCKYWTTMNPRKAPNGLFTANPNMFLRHGDFVAAADVIDAAAEGLMEYQQQQQLQEQQQFACLLNKNASILNHVTMVTRPLTR